MPSNSILDDTMSSSAAHDALSPHVKLSTDLLWAGAPRPSSALADDQWTSMPFYMFFAVLLAYLVWHTGLEQPLVTACCGFLGLVAGYLGFVHFPSQYWLAKHTYYGLTKNSLLRLRLGRLTRYPLKELRNVVYNPATDGRGNLGFLYRKKKSSSWVHESFKDAPQDSQLEALLKKVL